MKIILHIDDKCIGDCDWVDGLPEDGDIVNGHLIRLTNVRCENKLTVKSGCLIDVYYQFDNIAVSSSSVEVVEGFCIFQSSSISFFARGAVIFDMLKVKLVFAWGAGEDPVSFRKLNEHQRGSWLSALAVLNQSGSRPLMISSRKIFVPINLVSSRVDFYVLLGSIIFGKNGYFGQNLDSFEEYAIKYLSIVGNESRFAFVFHGDGRPKLSKAIGDKYLKTFEKILIELSIDFSYDAI